MKKILSGLLALVLAGALFTSCGAKTEDKVINLWSFTDEVPGMVEKYLAANPDLGYTLNTTIIATTDGAYQPALDQALQAGGFSGCTRRARPQKCQQAYRDRPVSLCRRRAPER